MSHPLITTSAFLHLPLLRGSCPLGESFPSHPLISSFQFVLFPNKTVGQFKLASPLFFTPRPFVLLIPPWCPLSFLTTPPPFTSNQTFCAYLLSIMMLFSPSDPHITFNVRQFFSPGNEVLSPPPQIRYVV